MIKLTTEQGDLYIRSGEILMLLPERGRSGCSMIYTQLFPDGLSIDMEPEEIYAAVLEEEGWEVETVEEVEVEIEDGEEHF
jgi:hypothetical protein